MPVVAESVAMKLRNIVNLLPEKMCHFHKSPVVSGEKRKEWMSVILSVHTDCSGVLSSIDTVKYNLVAVHNERDK